MRYDWTILKCYGNRGGLWTANSLEQIGYTSSCSENWPSSVLALYMKSLTSCLRLTSPRGLEMCRHYHDVIRKCLTPRSKYPPINLMMCCLRCVRDRAKCYPMRLRQRDLFINEEHDFWHHRSILSKLLVAWKVHGPALVFRFSTCSKHVDFNKEFDSVYHTGLLEWINSSGSGISLFAWLEVLPAEIY